MEKWEKCMICTKPIEINQMNFWDIIILCEECEKKLDHFTKCPYCKMCYIQLKESEFKNTSGFKEHIKKCRSIHIIFCNSTLTSFKSYLHPVELADYKGIIDSCTNLKDLLELLRKGYRIKTQKGDGKNGRQN